MTAQNAELIQRGYDAFARRPARRLRGPGRRDHLARAGIQPAVRCVPGPRRGRRVPRRTLELSGGTFGIDIQQVLAAGDQVVVLCTVSAERHGQSWSSPEDAFWSS
jgi:hypothetical protein